MTDTLELTAKRIAAQGRDALLARLRPAFADAASAHADILHVDDEQLEQMVQRAADRADGLQWRRALATVASQELGIGLGEALGHPAVERAQAIVGAPSYEDSLAALEARPDAPVALDRRPKMAPPSRAEPTPAPAEPRPTRADTTPTAPAEPRPTRADDKPTRPDPDVTRVAKATPAPANPASEQPETRVRRIEREPEEPERTVRRVERPPSRPESDVTRVQRRPTQPGPERRSTQDAPAEPRPKPASAAARAGQRPAASSAEQRPTSPQTRRSPAAPDPEQRPAAPEAEQRPAAPETRQAPSAPEAEQPPAAPETRQAPAAPEPEQRPAPRRAAPTARSAEPEGLRVSAIHLGGVANLKPGESEIELRLSEHGLDIARESGQIIGRLGWSEIEGIEVPPPRGFMWRRRAPRSHLVVRAGQGDASFEIPSVFPDELSEHLRPVLERYGRGTAML